MRLPEGLREPAGFPRGSDEEVTISALPLPDPEGTLKATRERREGSREPALRVDVSDADVESVLHALECYAGEDTRVRLAVRP